jgi:hypothetical protein
MPAATIALGAMTRGCPATEHDGLAGAAATAEADSAGAANGVGDDEGLGFATTEALEARAPLRAALTTRMTNAIPTRRPAKPMTANLGVFENGGGGGREVAIGGREVAGTGDGSTSGAACRATGGVAGDIAPASRGTIGGLCSLGSVVVLLLGAALGRGACGAGIRADGSSTRSDPLSSSTDAGRSTGSDESGKLGTVPAGPGDAPIVSSPLPFFFCTVTFYPIIPASAAVTHATTA